MIFFTLSLLLAIGFAISYFRSNFDRAMATWSPIVFLLLPMWLTYPFGGIDITFRLLFFFGAFGFYLLSNPPSILPGGLSIADIVITILTLTLGLSEAMVGVIGPLTIPEFMSLWWIPYMLGRLSLSRWTSIPFACNRWAYILAIVCCLALLESFALRNPIQWVFNKTFALLEEGEGYRWGIKRAMVSLEHPIFLGMALVSCLPWSLLAARQAVIGNMSKIWLLLPLLQMAAIASTASRGPIIAGIFVLSSIPFWRFPKFRILIGITAVGTFLGGTLFQDYAWELLEAATGDTLAETRQVYIDGVEYDYTGTNHRVLLFKVYEHAIEKAGWFGFGYDFVGGMSKAGIEIDEDLLARFGSIDNGYLAILIKHGWLNVILLIFFATIIVLEGISVGLLTQGTPGVFVGTLAIALFAVMVGLVAVWFSRDFAGIWLFHAGLVVTLNRLPVPAYSNAPPGTPADRTKLDSPSRWESGGRKDSRIYPTPQNQKETTSRQSEGPRVPQTKFQWSRSGANQPPNNSPRSNY